MMLEWLSYKMAVENGLGVLVVDLTCGEIKEVQAAYTNVSQTAIQAAQCANASNASTVVTGQTATSKPNDKEAETAEEQEDTIITTIWNGVSGFFGQLMGNGSQDTETGE